MAAVSEKFEPHNGQELYTRTWAPANKKRLVATVTFCHGIGEHIKRYDAVFTTFAEAGIAVHSFDQKGFGETGKKNGGLGHFISWQDLSSCIKEANKRIKTEGIPHFMMGHSMGGFEVLRFCAENPTEADGCIGSAPLVNVGEAVVIYSIQRFVVIQASYWLPWFSMPSPVDSIHLAKDPQVKKIYDSDPLNHSWVSFITAVEVVTGGEKLLAEGYKTFNVPLLITHGTQDKLTCPKASRQFFELVPVADEDKEYVSIQGGLHEMHNDEEKDQVISIWINWIKKRAEAKTPLVRPPVSPTVMKT